MCIFNEIIAAFLVTHLLACIWVQCASRLPSTALRTYAHSSNATRLHMPMPIISRKLQENGYVIIVLDIFSVLVTKSLCAQCIHYSAGSFGRCNVATPVLAHIMVGARYIYCGIEPSSLCYDGDNFKTMIDYIFFFFNNSKVAFCYLLYSFTFFHLNPTLLN